VIDPIQSIKRRLGQFGHGTGDLSEQDDTLLVGYRSDRIDEFWGRRLP
jgi:hypothetical protein